MGSVFRNCIHVIYSSCSLDCLSEDHFPVMRTGGIMLSRFVVFSPCCVAHCRMEAPF